MKTQVASQVSPSPIPNSNVVSLSATLLDRDEYLKGLVNQVLETKNNSSLYWLPEVKEKAANWVRHSTLPTTRDEEWRFTDLSALKQVNFNVASGSITSSNIAFLQECENSRLVFVNGVYAAELSAVSGLPEGITVTNLSQLPAEYTEKAKIYFAQAEGAIEVFTALNTAGMLDAAVIWIGKNVAVETPIHLIYVTTGENPVISQPRCLVVAETGSQVTLVEEFVTENQDGHFVNAVTEIWVGENASVNHSRIQKDNLATFHIGKTAVTQAKYSRYTCNAIAFGGKVSRHNLEILQTGEQTETTLNGLVMVKGEQVADMHSAIALNHPHGISNQLQKNIVADKAHAIFNGKVFVPKLAQETNASQLNRNLLLSPKARVDTKPQLEITADNVKCAHGATVSQLEDDEIFYLQSRGIDEHASRKLLINAFATEIINHIPVASLRDNLFAIVKQF
ncbi:Fe-S cluster assembly protein SufD [Calothrix sp. PCC 6303]|uniref:Fe-S cluster assembly protein SufD n=1 Tax=Calothrix sp. PCC 6303 TaxID=1170562 RepID=UPI0002A05526|nr:Fe-S cluster assembly protein SufD [Calothrix sp. PCC 6303]AFZ03834.1 Iron-regulated ABC transporter permease protein SufD [Calothrix sp. PCC 6303]